MNGTRPSNKNIHKQERGHARQLGRNPLKGILLLLVSLFVTSLLWVVESLLVKSC